ncbi:hypothetical protein [Roseateles sp.]|uniref:hypothetical protein n=1 Tax=Roseateles sp. TaxID=1971397 RepID=UPI0039E77212
MAKSSADPEDAETRPKEEAEFSKRRWVVLAGLLIPASAACGGGYAWVHDYVSKRNDRYRARLQKVGALRSMLAVTQQIHEQLSTYKVANPDLPKESSSKLGILQSYVYRAIESPNDPELVRMGGLINSLIEKNVAIEAALKDLAPTACTAALQQAVTTYEVQTLDFKTQWGSVGKYVAATKNLGPQRPFSTAIYDVLDKEWQANIDRMACDNPGAA